MGNYEDNYLAKRPQSLCKMCGTCCRVSTTVLSYKQLKKMRDAGDQGAIDFLSIFEPYPSIEDARKVSSAVVDNIIKALVSDNKLSNYEVTFYHCKYIKDDNTCSNYEQRPLLCRHFPSSPWAVVPPGCGFEGWLFEKREEIKQRIRKTKEELIELDLLRLRTTSESTLEKIDAVRNKMIASIDMYKVHGSEDW